MLEIFQQIRTQLENSNLVRERLKEIVQQLDDETRQMQAALQAVHSGSAEAGNIFPILRSVRTIFRAKQL